MYKQIYFDFPIFLYAESILMISLHILNEMSYPTYDSE